MKILFATSNNNKVKEVKEIISNSDIEFVSLKDLNDHDDVEENGSTFSENAYIKAKHFYDKYHMSVVSDDSGLCVEALNLEPGIFSSRYSGMGDKANINKLLTNMKNEDNRNAYFHCSVCFIDENGKAHYFEGKVYGKITDKVYGESGFGYDPIFYVEELHKTFGEASDLEKNKISHRYQAFSKFRFFLQNLK